MIIKASATLSNDYSSISDHTKSTSEPIYITKNGIVDGVFMSIEAYERSKQALQLRAKILQAEQECLGGAKTRSIADARTELIVRAGRV